MLSSLKICIGPLGAHIRYVGVVYSCIHGKNSLTTDTLKNFTELQTIDEYEEIIM